MKREALGYLAGGVSALTASYGMHVLLDYIRPPIEAEFLNENGATQKVQIDCQFDCPPPNGDETILMLIGMVLAAVGVLLIITSIRKAIK